jgi:hypothetical protein
VHNVVLAQGETHIPVVPICSPNLRIEKELSADDTGRGDCGRFWCFQQTPQTPGQNLDATRLVDEIDGACLEREILLGFESVAGKKHDGQCHAELAQFDEQFDARYPWQIPVEKDDVSLGIGSEGIGQRNSIGKATDDKPVIRQLISNDFATNWVVLDVEDADGVSFRKISQGLTRLICLIEHGGCNVFASMGHGVVGLIGTLIVAAS